MRRAEALAPLVAALFLGMAAVMMVMSRHQARIVLEDDTIMPEFTVSASMAEPHLLPVRNYPDPQAMPDAQLIKETVDEDAVAINKLKYYAHQTKLLRSNALDQLHDWTHLLDKARELHWDAQVTFRSG